MKVLILKPSSMGDVVQALPVLRLIKKHLPHSQVYWWLDPKLFPLLQGDPDVAGLIRFLRQRWAAPALWLEHWQTFRWIREQRFDWVIDLQGLARSGILAWLADGRFCIGVDYAREGARGYYDVVAPAPPHSAHAVDCYLSVLPFLGVPVEADFQWLPQRPEAVASLNHKLSSEGARWIAIQPGARWLNKRWPAESYAELAVRLAAARPELRFAILGGQEDQPLGQIIASAFAQGTRQAASQPLEPSERCLDLTGRLSLPEMIEFIRLSDLMVTNDTGPMHVAAALHKPVVALFGPTEWQRTGPYGQLDHVLHLDLPCLPCQKSSCAYHKPMECLRALSVSTVFARVMSLLG